ncbi:hypothetical protein LTR08_004159 [Meristemomyces frigidus]|nr:hypothetical protein LTR08_004159 [Meristemomyces frigidus]
MAPNGSSPTKAVDVFICGSGPVGLVLAYALTRLNISVHLIDAADKASPDFPMYGRACTLMPRTLEMLDQLDLFDDLAQVGLCGRGSFTYRDGQKLHGRGWAIFEGLAGQTFFDYAMNVRLKYSEDVFRAKLREMGVEVQAPVQLKHFALVDGDEGDYRVHATCTDVRGGETLVRAKYIVGSDGGASAVRKIAGIPFQGAKQLSHWVRIDGMVKTNLPESRVGFGSFESKTHGHVLWVSLDHGATRIGYVLSPGLFDKYGLKMTAAQAVEEAKQAVAPFELEFDEVHWHTVYGVQQHVAERFQDRERVLLAGDAAHTHSSASAQGMNTGMHDAVSLYWRLAGSVRGWYKLAVLATYSEERRAVSQQLIANDQLQSAVIAGEIPERLKGRGADPMTLVSELLKEQSSFVTGLGIKYASSVVSNVEASYPPIGILPGHRAPDVILHKPGMLRVPTRLNEVTKSNGKFRVVVFAGAVPSTGFALQSLRVLVDRDAGGSAHAVDFLTIIAGTALAVDEHLGVQRFGRAYWDIDHSAHSSYGIDVGQGALVVLRPDGMIGFVASMDGFGRVVQYLDALVIASEAMPRHVPNGRGARKELGELIVPDENDLVMRTRDGHIREEGVVSA